MKKHLIAIVASIVLAIASIPGVAFADDWVVTKLRGLAGQLVDGEWVVLRRGDIVSDSRVVRTLPSGKVQFKRDGETIDLGPDTQIQIFDKADRRYTTVKQAFGTVSIEANVENVEHFEVTTPMLAAVVKGTRFVVTSSKTGGSVKVLRGKVAVSDQLNGQSVMVSAGQTAGMEPGKSMEMSGRGKMPVVYDKNGQPLVATVGKVVDGAGNVVSSAGNAVNSVGNTAGNVVNSVGNTAGNVVSGVGESASNTVQNVASGASGVVSGTVGTVTGVLGGLL